MSSPLRLDVYPTDAEAFEAAAARAAEHLRVAPAAGGRLAVALSGGRSGRGVLTALAAADLPWERIDWCWADERCVPASDAHSNTRLVRESLLAPRAIPPEHVIVPPVECGDAGAVADAYGRALVERLGALPVLDLVLLGLGASGAVASLMPGSAALRGEGVVAAVPAGEVSEPPPLARVTLTARVLAAARRVIVVAAGDAKAAALAAAMGDPVDPARVPAHLVRPDERVAWFVDRAASAALLRGARPGP